MVRAGMKRWCCWNWRRGGRRVCAATGTALVLLPATLASAEPVVAGPDVALPSHGGAVSASSQHPSGDYPAGAVNDGIRETAGHYWNDGTQDQYPDWVQVSWPSPRTLNEIVLRLPISATLTAPQRTIGDLTLEYRDEATRTWRPVRPTKGTPNPVVDWVAPAAVNGQEERDFVFDDITTSAVRVSYARGNSDGWSYLEELQAYHRVPVTPPVSLSPVTSPGSRAALLQPGDTTVVRLRASDASGSPVSGLPVSFSATGGGGAVLDDQGAAAQDLEAVTGRDGIAQVRVRLGPRAETNVFRADASAVSAPATFKLHALTLRAALRRATAWLERTAGELEAGSRRIAFNGTRLYTPDGVGHYDALWTRDFEYMVEGWPDGVGAADLRNDFTYLIEAQRADGTIPDNRQADGTPDYVVLGSDPPTDNSQFLVKQAYDYYRLTGDLSLFEAHAQALVRAMRAVPRSPTSSLVYITPEAPHSGYGFTDSVGKTGEELFSSLLYVEAARDLAAMFRASGDPSDADTWEAEAEAVRRDVQRLRDPATGMFFAASVDDRQIDVWGSAYAAYIGAIPDAQADAVGRYLTRNYDGLVHRGQVRHLPAGTYWNRMLFPFPPGTYQNGGYWATPSGWVASAIARIDRRLARKMLIDLVRDFQANGVSEAFNDANGYRGADRYVASATAPLPAARALLRRR